MDKKRLGEALLPTEYQILEEVPIGEKTDKKGLRVRVKWQQEATDNDPKINRNGRSYPKGLLAREVARLAPKLENGEILGAAYHPTDGVGETTDVSHKWDKVWVESDGSCMGEITVLPTSKGNDIITQLQAGVKLGMSSRGFGTVTEKEKEINGKKIKYNEVNNDYKLESFGDWVLKPSVDDAGFKALIESIESQTTESEDLNIKNIGDEDLKDKITVEFIENEHSDVAEAIANKAKEGLFTEDQVKEKEKEVEERLNKEFEETLKEAVEKATETAKEEGRREAYLIVIDEIASKEGVLPTEDQTTNSEPKDKKNEKDDKELEDLKKKLKEIEEEKNALQKEKEEREEAEKKEKLQEDLKTKLNETLNKDEYKIYKSLIEKRLVRDGEVEIESVDKVESAVKALFDDISAIAIEASKSEITGNLDEKGHISNPEGGSEALLVEKNRKLYREAVLAGENRPFDEWLKANGKKE